MAALSCGFAAVSGLWLRWSFAWFVCVCVWCLCVLCVVCLLSGVVCGDSLVCLNVSVMAFVLVVTMLSVVF